MEFNALPLPQCVVNCDMQKKKVWPTACAKMDTILKGLAHITRDDSLKDRHLEKCCCECTGKCSLVIIVMRTTFFSLVIKSVYLHVYMTFHFSINDHTMYKVTSI